MDFLSGLFAVKQIVKLWPEKGLALDGDRPHFCVLRKEPFSSRFPYIILYYSDFELFYTSTFLYARTTSTIPSFLLLTQNKLI